MKAELVPENGGTPIPITRDLTIVGRREYCDVQVNDPSLSKRHCVIVKTDGLLVVRDLASTNGTKVKGQKIRWAALLPEDRLTIGAVKFRVYLGADDVPSPSERLAAKASGKPFRTPTTPPQVPVAVVNGSSTPPSGLGVFAEPSPMQGTPVVTHPRMPKRTPEPATAVVGNEDDLVLVDDDDDEIIELG